MISVDEALALVLAQSKSFGIEKVPLLQSAGRILATDIFADRDFPPFDRVMMDGIAIELKSFENGNRSFHIEGIQAAGMPAVSLSNTDNCIEVMTGAVLPENTNVVIQYEQCEIKDGVAIVISTEVKEFQYIHSAGSDARKGDRVLSKNSKITPPVISLLASTGHNEVSVLKRCKVAVCSTGDELVAVEQEPEPYQVRRSNSYFIAAALLAEGVDVTIDHCNDDYKLMLKQIESLKTQHDVLIFSGAVSKGKFDYLPKVFADLGMQTVFHQVAQKPGKPFLFGYFTNGPVVFAFPGNPLSTMVCYYYYFRPWLRACLQQKEQLNNVVLGSDVIFKPALTYHLPVQVANKNGLLTATPLAGSGSGDLVTITSANGIVTLPAATTHFVNGAVFPAILF